MASADSPPHQKSGVESEIKRLKDVFPGQIRVIKDVGEFGYVVNFHPEGLDINIKFQLTESYPGSSPNIIVKLGQKADGAEDLNNQLIEKSRGLCGGPMMKQLIEFAMDMIDVMGLDVQTAEKTKNKHKSKKKQNSEKPKEKTEEKEEKKPSLKTATDVISRIMWDESLPTDQFIVGYMDRFTGMVEKYFSMFSWEDIASVDYTVLAIPKHRIHYFKYKDVVVWDKDKRLDNVFGSAGSNLTIKEVIDQYEARAQGNVAGEAEAVKGEDAGCDDSDDDSDDGIQVTIGGASNSPDVHNGNEAYESNTKTYENDEKQYWQDKLRPNYFLAVRITNSEIREKVEVVRNFILQNEPLYEDCCIPGSSLHITLCVIRLDSQEQIANAVHVLQSAQSELAKFVPKEKPLTLEGLDHFYDRVVHAKVRYPPEFLELVDHLKLLLWEGGISNCDGYEFVPHMTLMKVSRPVARMKGTKKVDPSLYRGYSDLHFGTQTVDGIYLCAMGDERREDGFYITPTSIELLPKSTGESLEDSTLLDSDSEDDINCQESGISAKKQHRPELDDRVRSNYLLTVKITDSDIMSNVQKLQERMNRKQPIFQDFIIPPRALHVTFGTLRLESPEDVARASAVLEEAKSELSKILPRENPIEVEGVGIFFDRIVYAKIKYPPRFIELLNYTKTCLKNAGFDIREKAKYTPHLTLLRVSRQDVRVRHLEAIKPMIFEGHEEIKFGSQIVDGVYLCSVGKLS